MTESKSIDSVYNFKLPTIPKPVKVDGVIISQIRLSHLIRLEKKYRETDDDDYYSLETVMAKKLSETIGNKIHYRNIQSFICAIVGINGINPCATDEQIFEALEALGVSVPFEIRVEGELI